jgi:hypothetical protein
MLVHLKTRIAGEPISDILYLQPVAVDRLVEQAREINPMALYAVLRTDDHKIALITGKSRHAPFRRDALLDAEYGVVLDCKTAPELPQDSRLFSLGRICRSQIQ